MKAFFIDCDELAFAEAARSLQRERGWEVCFWTAGPELEDRVKSYFPAAVFQSNLAAARDIPPAELRGLVRRPPDAALLDALAPHENPVLKMMDRMGDGAAFLLDERLDLYYRYLGYWQAVLDKFQPEVVVFSFAPHLVYDYIVYLLCRLRGIRTVMFEFIAAIPGFLFAQEGFDLGISGVEDRYRNKLAHWDGGPVALSAPAQSYLDGINRNYGEGSPWYIKSHQEKAAQFNSAYTWKSLASYLVHPGRAAELVTKARKYLFDPPPRNYFKVPGKRLDQAAFTGLAWRRDRERRRRHKERMARYYKSLAAEADLDRPYILVALHFQPERTTAPLGGRYVDQLLMVRLLSRWLPTGWRLYIKEAPAYFFPHVTKQRARDRDFYDQIAALPNADLVDPDMNIFTLVDHARAVATVTGTVGWEALMRGKPALVFGHAWYKGCDGAYWAAEEASLRRALEEIQAGAKPREGKVRLFMQTLEEMSVGGCLLPRLRSRVDISDQENADRVMNAILHIAGSPGEI